MIQTISNPPTQALPSFYTRVNKTAKKILNCLKAAFSSLPSPRVYLGAKSWSIFTLATAIPKFLYKKCTQKGGAQFSLKDLSATGYRWHFEKKLEKEELLTYLPYYCMSVATYNETHDNWISSWNYKFLDLHALGIESKMIDGKVQVQQKAFFDSQTGLKVVIAENSQGEVLIGFGGAWSAKPNTTPEQFPKISQDQYHTSVKNLFGLHLPIFEQADRLIHFIKKHPYFAGKKIILCGACLGGALAQYAGIEHSLQAYCLNSLPLGAGLQRKLGDEKLKQADRYIHHLAAKGDYISSFKSVYIVDRILTAIGFRTPGSYGRRYFVDSVFKEAGKRLNLEGSRKTHDHPIKSVLKAIKQDYKLSNSNDQKDYLVVQEIVRSTLPV